MSPIKLVEECILVMWKGYCEAEERVLSESDEEKPIKGDSSSGESSDDESDSTILADVPHTVVFKCIGASRESDSQTALQSV